MKYHEQIKHPLWQKKRLEVLELNGFTCWNCGDQESELHVHHPYYKRGAMIWDYDADELQCLCHKCHKDEHAKDEKIKFLLGDPNINKDYVIGFLSAMNDSPHTKLQSHEEIVGYLVGYGITGQVRIELITGIIEADGKPNVFLCQLNQKTSFCDIGYVCGNKYSDLASLLQDAANRTKERNIMWGRK